VEVNLVVTASTQIPPSPYCDYNAFKEDGHVCVSTANTMIDEVYAHACVPLP
jgi:hypothetical protein